MSTIELHEVEKVYDGTVPAVRRLSLDVAAGEFLVLVGPSGCGKSTTLRMIAGLETVTAGRIRIGDQVVDAVAGGKRRAFVAPRDRDLALVFQNYALYPHMTVAQNLAFPLKMRKVPRAERARRVAEVAAVLGLTELLARRPAALSGGQRQRVAVGRCLVRNTRVFLFDEPLSNLDAALRQQMRAELKRLHQRLGVTMVYVTHDQIEAMTLGDRIALLHQGELQQLAPPHELYRRPANRFVAGFIGQQPMNFLDGRIEGGAFVTAAGALAMGGLRLEARGLRPEPQASSLKPQVSSLKPFTAGVRPEHLVPVDADAPGPALTGTVDVVEPLGDETLVTLETPAGRLLVRERSGAPPARGTVRRYRAAPDDLHFFAADGRRLEW